VPFLVAPVLGLPQRCCRQFLLNLDAGVVGAVAIAHAPPNQCVKDHRLVSTITQRHTIDFRSCTPGLLCALQLSVATSVDCFVAWR
jgi:hypothetical protein